MALLAPKREARALASCRNHLPPPLTSDHPAIVKLRYLALLEGLFRWKDENMTKK